MQKLAASNTRVVRRQLRAGFFHLKRGVSTDRLGSLIEEASPAEQEVKPIVPGLTFISSCFTALAMVYTQLWIPQSSIKASAYLCMTILSLEK